MASTVPPPLKTADINRFAQRAGQLEKVKPAIAYWCYYWIVKQILSKNLHTSNDECKAYVTELMDKLEQMKEHHPSDDAIVDDMAGQAYVEQFGLETFSRADSAVLAGKATKQTADTYLAAATFLDLLQIWAPHPPADVAQKTKYAKYHALRIAKALKAGEDPNLSNPVREDAAAAANGEAADVAAVEPLDPRDPEVQDIMGTLKPPSVRELGDEAPEAMEKPGDESNLRGYRPPTVTGEEGDAMDVDGDDADLTLLPSAAVGSPLAQQPVSPASVHDDNDNDDGYFPVPSQPEPHFPLHAAATSSSQPSSPLPHPLPGPSTALPLPFPHPHPHSQPATSSSAAPAPTLAPAQPPRLPASAAQPAQHQKQQEHYLDDDAAVAAAQKHARWAISALNFEDAPTAVRELRAALRALGARS